MSLRESLKLAKEAGVPADVRRKYALLTIADHAHTAAALIVLSPIVVPFLVNGVVQWASDKIDAGLDWCGEKGSALLGFKALDRAISRRLVPLDLDIRRAIRAHRSAKSN